MFPLRLKSNYPYGLAGQHKSHANSCLPKVAKCPHCPPLAARLTEAFTFRFVRLNFHNLLRVQRPETPCLTYVSFPEAQKAFSSILGTLQDFMKRSMPFLTLLILSPFLPLFSSPKSKKYDSLHFWILYSQQ